MSFSISSLSGKIKNEKDFLERLYFTSLCCVASECRVRIGVFAEAVICLNLRDLINPTSALSALPRQCLSSQSKLILLVAKRLIKAGVQGVIPVHSRLCQVRAELLIQRVEPEKEQVDQQHNGSNKKLRIPRGN